MKNLTINRNTFHMDKESYTFLSNYIDRLKRYINNKLDQDLYDDIMTRLEEKLTQTLEKRKKKEIIPKDAIQIVNSLGEPEDIFENEGLNNAINILPPNEKQKDSTSGSFFQKVYGDIILFWGIFLFMTIIMGMNALVLLFFICFIAFIVYLFRESKRKSIKNFFGFLGVAIKRMRKNILTVARIVFFCGFGLFLISMIIPVVLGIGAYFSNFTLYNVEIFALVHWTLPIAAILGGLSLVLFGVLFVSYGIRKQGIGNIRTMIAFVSLFAGILLASINGFLFFKTYYGEGEKTIVQEEQMQITDTSPVYDIVFIGPDYVTAGGVDVALFSPWGAKIKTSPDDTLKVITEIVRFGPEEQKENISSYMQPLTIKKQENRIEIGYENQQIFTKKIPFIPMHIRLKEIHIPSSMRFTGSIGEGQISLPQSLEKYEPIIDTNDCEYYYFEEDSKMFRCYIDPKHREEMINSRVLPYLIRESISGISPLKHNEEYMRNYYNEPTNQPSDRKVTKIDRAGKSGEELTIHYNDQSLMITATATLQDYEESASLLKDDLMRRGNVPQFVISDFKITKITKNPDTYQAYYYENPSIVEEYSG